MPAFSLLAPRHWPSWLALGVLRIVALLPYRALRALGHALGAFTARVPGQRRHVARRNLAVCFPQLDDAQRERLLRDALADLGLMLVEFALAWFGSERALARVPCRIEGLEHLFTCRAQGHGVLLVGAHFSHLELCARLVSQRIRIAGMYRVMDDAVFERAVLRARLHYADAMFAKDELRACVKYLKRGGTVWYAPDQDMRGKESVFAPFFGVPAATITATHHLARLSGARVIPFFHRRDAHGYVICLHPPLEAFPSADVLGDTTRVNASIQDMVCAAPSQYLWVHKRFKTRPPGSAPIY